ncbi:MAG TPA: 3-deoxy-D-manno-octulosonic acid transferase [Candidatus Obscuribacterales bacterium]
MIALYNLFSVIFLLIASPIFLVKKKARYGLAQKLGFVPESVRKTFPRQPRPVWFHAVSVGEFNALRPLLEAFRINHPEIPVVVSTTTGTGQQLARERVGDWATVIYFPYDVPWATKNWLNVLKPQLVVIVETEIWPGFIDQCARRLIPLAVVNGRLSPRSHRFYMRLRALFGPTLRKIEAIGVQTKEEKERYISVGAASERTIVLGNMKFDGLIAKPEPEVQKLKKALNLDEESLVVVAGSTHDSEESAVLEAFGLLRKHPSFQNRDLRLIIVPRHPERFSIVAELITSRGYHVIRHSRNEAFSAANDVYLLDVIGKLATFYGLADAAFVGGTLAPIGGHNILEPYAYSVPVLCGPHLEKTRDLALQLKAREALYVVNNSEELAEALALLLANRSLNASVGQRGNELLMSSQGAVGRAMVLLNGILSATGKQTAAVKSLVRT